VPKFLVLLFTVPLVLFAYVDSDMDGVEDKDDHCPNTLITDLVDLKGCRVTSLLSPHHFTFLVGSSSVKDNDIRYGVSSLEFDYAYKEFSLQIAGSYYDIKGETLLSSEGFNDTHLNFFYRFHPFSNFSLSICTGLLFPTYDSQSNQIDYIGSLVGKYQYNTWSLSTGLGYKIVSDINRSDTYFYSFSIGKDWGKNLYSSISYSVSESSYTDVGMFKRLSLYNYYSINKNWFGTLSFSEGLNEQSLDNKIGVKLGYYW